MASSNATTTEEVREILESFYGIYHPEKLGSISMILDKYVDSYDKLLEQLRDKYAAEFNPIYNVHIQKKKAKGVCDKKVEESPCHVGETTTAKVADKLDTTSHSLESQISRLKTEKFQLASDNLAQAEELELLHNQKKQIGNSVS